jgi:hypothetical protein
LLDLNRQHGKLLIYVVMQLAGDTRTLLLLGVDQAPTEFLDGLFVTLSVRYIVMRDNYPLPSRLRKKSVRVEIGGIFGDTKPSPATLLALLGQLCAICFSRFLAQTTFSATC